MSAASRQREIERRQRLLDDRYGPFPDPGVIPPPLSEQDPELAKRIAWFCTNRQKIADTLDIQAVFVNENGVMVEYKPKPVDTSAAAILAAASALIGR